MIRPALAICALVALSACGALNPDDTPAGRSDTHQQPTVTTPGIHVSGYANVGVIRRF